MPSLTTGAFSTPTYRSNNTYDQMGSALGSAGASGSVVVTLPVGYTSTSSYKAFAVHTDTSAGLRLSVVITAPNSFTIYWVGGGATTQPFNWFATGS